MEEIQRREQHIRRKVLVVDDELVNRQLLGFIISRDFDVLYAENGVQALELIRSGSETLSLVLLDLLMPEMDGYELLEILRSDERLRRIPVIVLTSEKSAEVQSLQRGAVDFITKPYDLPDVILARVHRSIELAEDKVMIRQTERDALTDLYTKPFFFQYALQHDRYFPDAAMDAVALNINRFHVINELYGRAYGDRVLKTVAGIIRDMLAENDGLACRCDPDTFLIYLPHMEDQEAVFRQCSEAFYKALGNTRIHVRAGVYQNADRSISIEQRFDRAGLVCNKLRTSFDNAIELYDTQTHEKELHAERLIMDIDNALAERQFIVYYQPKYNIRGDHPVLSSAEALIRWIHPEFGMISPGLFIPLFEENGLVQKLDRYVWREAAAQIRRWKEQYGRTIPVSVNVSRVDIYDPNLEQELEEIITSEQLSPAEYLLEITESAYTDDSTQIIQKVERLRSKGFRIEMDDFGSGYSSLNMLSELPIDALKLDMKFFSHICDRDKDRRMVELMLEIAEFLGVPVIAEGVEEQAQYLLLKNMGCDIIQGYYFSKPVPPEEFARLIEQEQKGAYKC